MAACLREQKEPGAQSLLPPEPLLVAGSAHTLMSALVRR